MAFSVAKIDCTMFTSLQTLFLLEAFLSRCNKQSKYFFKGFWMGVNLHLGLYHAFSWENFARCLVLAWQCRLQALLYVYVQAYFKFQDQTQFAGNCTGHCDNAFHTGQAVLPSRNSVESSSRDLRHVCLQCVYMHHCLLHLLCTHVGPLILFYCSVAIHCLSTIAHLVTPVLSLSHRYSSNLILVSRFTIWNDSLKLAPSKQIFLSLPQFKKLRCGLGTCQYCDHRELEHQTLFLSWAFLVQRKVCKHHLCFRVHLHASRGRCMRRLPTILWI